MPTQKELLASARTIDDRLAEEKQNGGPNRAAKPASAGKAKVRKAGKPAVQGMDDPAAQEEA